MSVSLAGKTALITGEEPLSWSAVMLRGSQTFMSAASLSCLHGTLLGVATMC